MLQQTKLRPLPLEENSVALFEFGYIDLLHYQLFATNDCQRVHVKKLSEPQFFHAMITQVGLRDDHPFNNPAFFYGIFLGKNIVLTFD